MVSFSLRLYSSIRRIISVSRSSVFVQEGFPRLRSVSISGRGRVMRLLFWDKLEPFVTVVNHNGCCKPKFVLGFYFVRSTTSSLIDTVVL